MPHRTHRRRRYAGRVLALSVLGWALFSTSEETDPAEAYDRGAPAERDRELGLDDLDVVWDIPAYEPQAPAAAMTRTGARGTRKRRLATSLAFATLFFAGAALSAGAGDMVVGALDSTDTTATETTASADAGSDPGEATAPSDPAPESGGDPAPAGDPGPTDDESAGEGDGSTDPAPAGDGSTEGDGGSAAGGDGGSAGDPGSAPDDGSAEPPTDSSGGDPGDAGSDSGENPAAGQDGNGQGEPASDGTGSPSAGSPDGGSDNGQGSSEPPAGQPVLDPQPSPVTDSAPPDPEVAALGTAATIWLHRTLPDPTPPARRLAPAFARTLRTESARAGADWALVFGVLRAEGRVSRRPTDRAGVKKLAARLVALGARHDEWQAVAALKGRTAFADRAVALARYGHAVGLRALVVGLTAAKPALERAVLRDSRLDIYPGGRGDVAAHRIDVRVLVAMRYLAEAFGQVTVSCLESGHRLYARPGVVSAHIYGLAVDVAALGGVSIAGHQQIGSVTERAVRDVLLLPRELQARQVISLIGMGGPSFALSNHDDHIHIGF